MNPIAFVRHGQTAWNAAQRIQGITDIPLDDVGRGQAIRAAHLLYGLDQTWHLITSSPLSRASETAAIISRHLPLTTLPHQPDIVERGYGEAEGRTFHEAREIWPDGSYPGAESREDLRSRGTAAAERLTRSYGPIIAVAHGTFIRETVSALSDINLPPLANGDVVIVDLAESGEWRATHHQLAKATSL